MSLVQKSRDRAQPRDRAKPRDKAKPRDEDEDDEDDDGFLFCNYLFRQSLAIRKNPWFVWLPKLPHT